MYGLAYRNSLIENFYRNSNMDVLPDTIIDKFDQINPISYLIDWDAIYAITKLFSK